MQSPSPALTPDASRARALSLYISLARPPALNRCGKLSPDVVATMTSAEMAGEELGRKKQAVLLRAIEASTLSGDALAICTEKKEGRDCSWAQYSTEDYAELMQVTQTAGVCVVCVVRVQKRMTQPCTCAKHEWSGQLACQGVI